MMEVYPHSHHHHYHGFIPPPPAYGSFNPTQQNCYNDAYFPHGPTPTSSYQFQVQGLHDNKSMMAIPSAFETYKPQSTQVVMKHEPLPEVKPERESPKYYDQKQTFYPGFSQGFVQSTAAFQDQLPAYNSDYNQFSGNGYSSSGTFIANNQPAKTTKAKTSSGVTKNPPKRGRRTKKCQCSNCQLPPLPNDEKTGKPKQRKHNCHFPGCHREYGKTSHLKSHIMWHEDQRPFRCHFATCDKKFTRSDELSRHIKTHTKEQIHKCTVCGKGFGRSDHRNKHMKIHDKQHFAKPRGRKSLKKSVQKLDTFVVGSSSSSSLKSSFTASLASSPLATLEPENSNLEANRQPSSYRIPAVAINTAVTNVQAASSASIGSVYQHPERTIYESGQYGGCLTSGHHYPIFQNCDASSSLRMQYHHHQ